MNRYVSAIISRFRRVVEIDSIGVIYLIGEFEDGVDYYATPEGDITTDITGIFLGTGNADGDIDLDIKMLAITDVLVPETVQLDIPFDVSGNYVMLEDKIVIEGYNDDSSTWVKLHVGDYIDVTGGSFTETVTIKSADGFIPNTSVTIRVRSYDGYALNGIDSTDVIATITINSPTLTAGTEGNVTGTSNGVEVDVYFRTSADEEEEIEAGEWEVFEEGVEVDEEGNWSATGTIADAGAYDFKVEDTTDRDGFAQVDDVTVASGAMLTAFQFGGSTAVGETANFTAPLGVKIVGEYIYVGGYTRATKILGQSTGSNGSITCAYYAKFDLQYNLQWIKFYEYSMIANATPNFVIVGDYIFVLDCVYNAGTTDYNTTVRKLALSDGTLVASRLLSNVNGDGFGTCIDYYDGNIYVGGGSNDYAWKMTLWTLPLDLSTDSKVNYNNAGTASPNGYICGLTMLGDGNFAIAHNSSENVQIFTIGTTNNIGNYTSAGQDQNGNYSKSATRFLALTRATMGGFKFDMRAYPGISSSIYSETYSSNANASIGMSRWDGSKFLALYNDETKFYLASIADSDTYSKTAIAEHTPNAITAISCVASGLDWSNDYYVITGRINGKMESDSVSSGFYDTFIKIIEK